MPNEIKIIEESMLDLKFGMGNETFRGIFKERQTFGPLVEKCGAKILSMNSFIFLDTPTGCSQDQAPYWNG